MRLPFRSGASTVCTAAPYVMIETSTPSLPASVKRSTCSPVSVSPNGLLQIDAVICSVTTPSSFEHGILARSEGLDHGQAAGLLAAVGEGAFPDADAFSARVRRDALFGSASRSSSRAHQAASTSSAASPTTPGLVLGLPVRSAALAAAQAASDGQVIAVSGHRRLAIAAADLVESPLPGLFTPLLGARRMGRLRAGDGRLLAREERLPVAGLRLLLSSSVPEGKGLGSSAAVEIAGPLQPAGRSASLEPGGSRCSGSAGSSSRGRALRRHGPDRGRMWRGRSPVGPDLPSCGGGRLVRASSRPRRLGNRLWSAPRRPRSALSAGALRLRHGKDAPPTSRPST